MSNYGSTKATEFMKDFLNETKKSIENGKHGNDILSDAVKATTNFKDIDSLIDAMILDATDNVTAPGAWQSDPWAIYDEDRATFNLAENFGIIFDDEDTGAVIGLHSGGDIAYNAEDIVPETGSITGTLQPTPSEEPVTKYFTNAEGKSVPVNIIWKTDKLYLVDPNDEEADVDDIEGIELSDLTARQRTAFNTIVEGLDRWWITQACSLNDFSYGFSMENATLKMALVSSSTDEEIGFTAATFPKDENGVIDMVVNFDAFDSIDSSDVNGNTDDSSGQVYLDRIISHEMTHAVMFYHDLADLDENDDSRLPGQYTEGIADFTHGGDDSNAGNEYEFKDLAGNYNYLKSALSLTSGTGEENFYTAGYMMMKYLAKQSTGQAAQFSVGNEVTIRSIDDGMYLTQNGTQHVLNDSVIGSFNIDSDTIITYLAISTIDGQNITINDNNSWILTATENKNTITLGTGDTTVIANGQTTINNFKADDVLSFADEERNKAVNFADEGLTLYTDTVMSPEADYVQVVFNDVGDSRLVNLKYCSDTTEQVAFISDDDIYNVTLGEADEYIGATASNKHGVRFDGITTDVNVSLEGDIFENIHSLIGGSGNTTFTGSSNDDTLIVGTGNTTINASGGTDYIVTNGDHTTYVNGTEVTTLYSSTWRSVDGKLEDMNGFFYDGDEFKAIMQTGDIILGDGYLRLGSTPRITLSEDTVAGTFAAINNQLYGWSGQAGGIVDITKSGIANSDRAAKQKIILIGIAPNGPSTLIGGSNDDSIFAGGGDTVKLSGGKDFISIDHTNREEYEGRSNQDRVTLDLTGGISSNSTVENYKVDTDVLKVDNINDLTITKVSDNLRLKSDDFTVTIKDTDKIEINDSVGSWGENLSYKDSISYYGGSSAATLNVTGNVGAESVAVWLDNSGNKIYNNVKDINANNYNGDSTLAGNDYSNVITASKGSSSIWGGNDGDDTLVGSDNYNEFFYLKDNGNDEIKYAKDSDLIRLMDISLDDIASADIGNMRISLSFKDGGSLSMKTMNDLTFELSDGSRYTSDGAHKIWNQTK